MELTATLWGQELADLSNERRRKPRAFGCTMVIDKGLGLTSFRDLLELAGEHIDFIKLAFGTAAITPLHILQGKVEWAKRYGVSLYPGGTFFEIAHAKGKHERFFHTVQDLGMEWVEISDGTIDLSLAERSRIIRTAKEKGLRVVSEIGKKTAGHLPSLSDFLATYQNDLDSGVTYVIMEGRESGKGVGIFDETGRLNRSYIEEILKRAEPTRLIFETPEKSQQIEILKIIGNQANFGNIPHNEVLALECLRRGLRADTLPHYFASCRRDTES
jgi:phosphosulfolactate synthase